MKLDHDRGGSGRRLLVLLHGLGATREVWRPMLDATETHWVGRWVAPDLRGHGRSAHSMDYSLGCHAADVAELVCSLEGCEEIVVIGHSMGGVVALALASGWFGFAPKAVCGLGIKVAWQQSELEQLAARATSPVRYFETAEDAVERYLKVSGLSALAAPDSKIALAGIASPGQGWRLAADPATASVGAPPMRGLLAAAAAPVHLGRGTGDAMVTREQLLEFDSRAADISGGHNVMVENPAAVWQWLAETVS